MRTFVLFVASIFSVSVQSEPNAYSCEITGEYVSASDGRLKESGMRIYVGEKFHVDRSSGVVLGDGVGNSSYPTKTVIDQGGAGQAYKLIWISKDVVGTDGGKNVVYLSVYEYVDENIKPFSMVLGARVLSGICF